MFGDGVDPGAAVGAVIGEVVGEVVGEDVGPGVGDVVGAGVTVVSTTDTLNPQLHLIIISNIPELLVRVLLSSPHEESTTMASNV